MDFFTADLHFSHTNIIRYSNRPFSNVNEMDDALINNINSLVKSDDTLWFLGDFCFGPKDVDQFIRHAQKYRNRINCSNIILVWGNHDPDPFSLRKEEQRRADAFRHMFIEDYSLRNTVIMKQRVSLCHYAMSVWDRSHHGAWQLYGHSHAGLENWMDQIMPGRKSMDVGVDNIAKLLGGYRPISFPEVMKIMNSKAGFSRHHDE